MMPPMPSGGGSPSNTAAMAAFAGVLIKSIFKTLPMIVIAFYISSIFQGYLVNAETSVDRMVRFNLTFNMPDNPTYIYVTQANLYLYGLVQAFLIYLSIVLDFKGWWKVHENAGKAITANERKFYKLKLYGLMTALLTLIVLILKITIFY